MSGKVILQTQSKLQKKGHLRKDKLIELIELQILSA